MNVSDSGPSECGLQDEGKGVSMRKFGVIMLVLLLSATVSVAAEDLLNEADDLFEAEEYITGFRLLEDALPAAVTNREKADIYWRMARFQLNITDDEEDAGADKDTLLDMFAEGQEYAQMAIDLFPSADAYYWHSSNMGRWGEIKGILDSLFKAAPMKEDLLKVIEYDALYADAWYVFGRLYLLLPGWPLSFGNIPFAASFARRAIDTYAKDDLKISYYKSLAEILWKRDWSADKREREINNRERKLNSARNEHDTQAYYESALGAGYSPEYTNLSLKELSDREEARIITDWLLDEYENIENPDRGDRNNIREVKEMVAEW